MFNIVICDDNQKYLAEINDIIKKKIIIEDLDAEIILVTDKTGVVMNTLDDGIFADLYILDVDFGENEFNGVDLGRYIRERDVNANIVYLTAHNSYIGATFKYYIGVLDYIEKGELNTVDRLRQVLMEAYKIYQKRSEQEEVPHLALKVDGRIEFINYEDILFIESSPSRKNKVVFHLINGRKEIIGNLKDFENIDTIFCRCHTSYIANKNNIELIDKKTYLVRFINGEEIYASRRLLKKNIGLIILKNIL